MQTGDIKTGMTFIYDGKIYTAVEWQHVCQPRLAAFIRARIKNVETGAVLERNFKTNENVEICQIERKEMEYLYNDNDIYYFMDMETYEQLGISKNEVGDSMKYIMENTPATIERVNGKVINVAPPIFVNLKVVDTEPAVQGDTSKSAMKSAKLETGLEIKVPLFVGNDDTVKVDTRTCTYIERL